MGANVVIATPPQRNGTRTCRHDGGEHLSLTLPPRRWTAHRPGAWAAAADTPGIRRTGEICQSDTPTRPGPARVARGGRRAGHDDIMGGVHAASVWVAFMPHPCMHPAPDAGAGTARVPRPPVGAAFMPPAIRIPHGRLTRHSCRPRPAPHTDACPGIPRDPHPAPMPGRGFMAPGDRICTNAWPGLHAAPARTLDGCLAEVAWAVLLAPDGELVPARIGEVESAAAGEREDRFDDSAAGLAHPGFGGGEVDGVDDDQCTLPDRRVRAEPAREAPILEAGVVGPVVRELPTERVGVEPLGRGDVGGGHLDVEIGRA